MPFMLVTAESEQKHILEAAKAGVSDYVVKPFNSATLKAKMERVWQNTILQPLQKHHKVGVDKCRQHQK